MYRHTISMCNVVGERLEESRSKLSDDAALPPKMPWVMPRELGRIKRRYTSCGIYQGPSDREH